MVIRGLKEPPALIGRDLMCPLQVQIDVSKGIARPLTSSPPGDSLFQATVMETAKVPGQSVCFIKCQAPPASSDLLFTPSPNLPLYTSSISAVVQGQTLWVPLHNYRSDPVTFSPGHTLGTLEMIAEVSSAPPPSPSPSPAPTLQIGRAS